MTKADLSQRFSPGRWLERDEKWWPIPVSDEAVLSETIVIFLNAGLQSGVFLRHLVFL